VKARAVAQPLKAATARAKPRAAKVAPKARAKAAKAESATPGDVGARVREALAWLEAHATKKTLEGMARYGIPQTGALGVMIRDIQALAKSLGRSHELSLALWDTGGYEARLLAAYVGEPERITAAQMERWRRDFDSWAVVDTVCFALFRRAEAAWDKVPAWAALEDENGKRAGFALLACLSKPDDTPDAPYLEGLRLIEAGALDERHLVKKGVSWALRCIGKRNDALREAALATARRLAESENAAARWVGKDAIRDLRK